MIYFGLFFPQDKKEADYKAVFCHFQEWKKRKCVEHQFSKIKNQTKNKKSQQKKHNPKNSQINKHNMEEKSSLK